MGVAIGGVIFQNQIRHNLSTYASLAPLASTYAKDASSLVQIIKTMAPGPDRHDLIQSYADALKVVWIVMCALSAVAMVLSAGTKGLDLDRELETEQGFVYERRARDEEKVGSE